MQLLDDDLQRGWLPVEDKDDRHGSERRAIVEWIGADALRHDKRLHEALDRLERALKHCPEDTPLRRRMASSARAIHYELWRAKDHRSALRAALLASTLDDKDATNWRSVGVAYGWLKNHEKALEHKRKALELDDTDATIWREVGISYGWLKNHEKALEYTRKALELDDTDSDNWRQVGASYGWLRQYEPAKLHLRRAVEIDEFNGWAWCQLGRVALWSGDLGAATAAAERSIQCDPMDPVHHDLLAITHWVQGHREEACDAFARAIALKTRRGRELALTGLWAAAESVGRGHLIDADFRERTRKEVRASQYSVARFLLLMVEGQDEAAIEALDDVVQRSPAEADRARTRPECERVRDDTRFRAITAPLLSGSGDEA